MPRSTAWSSREAHMPNPEDIALISRDEKLTYGEMIAAADAVASHVEPRDLVFLVASNTVASICGYVGFERRRAVPLMLREETGAEQFAHLMQAYTPRYVWAKSEFCDEMADVLGPCEVVFEDRGNLLLSTGAEKVRIDSETALLLTTSGSTGTPKFVRLSAENLASNAESIAQYQKITEKDRAITTLPFSYTFGISIVNSHLLRGASVVLTEESILSRGFWDLLRETGATNFGGVPYTYQMLEKLRFGRMDLPSLRFIAQAGGRLGERLQELFGTICAEKGIEFYVMYGQTEATARMSWLPPEHVLDKLGSIGIAIPGGEFELRDASDALIEGAGVVGELVYRGSNVSLGYATCAAELDGVDERGGVLHTGDMAKRDEDGYYYVVGRLKRFLKMFGNRVNLDELEHIFSQRGYELACVGSDDHMVIFSTTDEPESLRRAIAEETKLYPKAFEVRTLAEIPHMASGKIDYKSLEELC